MFDFEFEGPFLVVRKEGVEEERLQNSQVANDFMEEGLIPFCFIKDKNNPLFQECLSGVNQGDELVTVVATLNYNGKYYA